eukprot:TRINITY_DN71311_c0_g1_i1.p1 TRINITY_DN71311_c0_g1~~TRINITY_DN71311_c0_g1_i1.p1  ORF type:complete len:321 (+),score=108.77 TRINITY_DN71311_c0_g1_i1:79-963(+)
MWWLLPVVLPLLSSLLLGAALVWWAARKEQKRLAERFRDALQILMYTTDGELYKALHPRARDAAEKPLVHALQRAVQGQLGKPRNVQTSTLERLEGASEGFVRCRAMVEFEQGEGLVHICWEEGPPRAERGPQSCPRLLELRVDPDNRQLDLAQFVLPESLEQKSDQFLNHLFHGRIKAAYELTDQRLREKLSEADLLRQGQSVLRMMGITVTAGWEVDTAYQGSKQVGPLARSISAVMCGDAQDATAELLWAFDTMASKLLKFEVKTTGKPKRETVFVNPDGTRYDPASDGGK